MNMKPILIGMVTAMAAFAAIAEAPVTATMSERVDRLEKMISEQSGYAVQANLQEMRDEIQTLRGMLEVQQFELDKLKESQKSLYADLDKRLSGSDVTATAPSAAAKAMGPSGAASVSAGSPSLPVPGNQLMGGGNIAPIPGAPTEAETKQYEAAYVMLTEQKYSAAIPALKEYIKTYPDGQYVASAYYWLGETQTIADDLDQAKVAFQTVIDKYPSSPKVVDATLKLGMVYEDAGQYDKALAMFKQVIAKYPNTPQARLANERIQQIDNINR